MKSVPKFMQGVYTSAMRQVLDFVSLGEDRGDEELQSRAWKLFFFLPRMFLFRPCRGVQVLVSSVQAVNVRARARRRSDGDDIQKEGPEGRSTWCNWARFALEGASLAAGDQKTSNARRPPVPRDSVPDDIAGLQPEEPFVLDQCTNGSQRCGTRAFWHDCRPFEAFGRTVEPHAPSVMVLR